MAKTMNQRHASWRTLTARAAICFSAIWTLLAAVAVVVDRPREVPWHDIVSSAEFWPILVLPPLAAGILAGTIVCSIRCNPRVDVPRSAQTLLFKGPGAVQLGENARRGGS